jgi:hypothetical protein
MYGLPQQISELIDAARQWFDAVPLDSLMLVAIAFHLGARRFRYANLQAVPYIFASLFFVSYFLHRYTVDGSGFGYVLASLLRSLFAYHIVWSVSMIAVAIVCLLHVLLVNLRTFCCREFSRWRFRIETIRMHIRFWWRRRHPLPLPPPPYIPRPVPRAVTLRLQAEAAEADYDAETAALDGLPLDDDEREVLICAAKQRLIRKLNQNE